MTGGKKTGCVLTLSSPLLLTDLNINNPTSEVVFLPGKALGFLTEKIFENETGQSVMLGLFLLSLGLTSIYFHGLTARTVRQMQIYQATKFGQIGHPYYTVKAIPQNPLLKAKKI